MSSISVDDLPCYGACWWGFNQPGGFLWARVFPNGRVYIQKSAVFHEIAVETAADLIHAGTRHLGVRVLKSVVTHPAMFTDDEKAETQIVAEGIADTFRRYGVSMTASDDDRVNGWQRVHDYLRLAPDGQPWLVVSPACPELEATLPTLMQKPKSPDEPDSDEWAPHALRLLLVSRPSPAALATRKAPFAQWTVGWLKGLTKTPTGPLQRR
jgi:hypothetical protein